jgi:hypothetical protein
MITFLGRSKTLLGEQSDEGETCGVIGGHVSSFWIGIGDGLRGCILAARVADPPFARGLPARDMLQVTGVECSADLVTALRPAHDGSAWLCRSISR